MDIRDNHQGWCNFGSFSKPGGSFTIYMDKHAINGFCFFYHVCAYWLLPLHMNTTQTDGSFTVSMDKHAINGFCFFYHVCAYWLLPLHMNTTKTDGSFTISMDKHAINGFCFFYHVCAYWLLPLQMNTTKTVCALPLNWSWPWWPSRPVFFTCMDGRDSSSPWLLRVFGLLSKKKERHICMYVCTYVC